MSKIVIDAGHGKNTAGKRCLKSFDQNETREWVLNARVADALETYLLGAGHATLRVDDGSGNTDVSLATRVKTAKSYDENFARTYIATIADLKLRAEANDKYDVLDSVPEGGKVRCYGYYTKESDETVWLYVVYKGQEGFISKSYLL